MNGPKRITELGRPSEGEPLVELRFINADGKTEVWMLKREMLDFEGLSSPERVRLAYLDEGVDVRLGNQKAAISRLQEQLDSHHSEHDMLSGCEVCGYGLPSSGVSGGSATRN